MILVDIKSFALSGNFGPILIGARKRDVVTILGTPEDEIDYGDNGSEITYGWYELFFNAGCQLYAIQNDNYDGTDDSTYMFENDKISIVPWLMTSPEAPKFEAVVSILKAESIPFSNEKYYGRRVLWLRSGVMIDFHETPRAIRDRKLLGFRYWPLSK